MPEVRLARIVSVSSEDPKTAAKNLCGPVGSGKWKTATSGEKQATVIVQFQTPAKITGLHVGNECSAFVEVFVGKESTHYSEQDWQVLLAASSFMTPSDARTNTNIHKVRLFQEDSLVKSASGQTWDRAKIVCTQPFNKSITYGLSFISFLSDDVSEPEQSKVTEPASKSEKLGAFTLMGDDSDDNLPTGTMFSQRKRIQASESTVAAAIREAARLADDKVGVAKTTSSPATKKAWPDYPKPEEKQKEQKPSKPIPSTSRDTNSSKAEKSTTKSTTKSAESSKPVRPNNRIPDEKSGKASTSSTGKTTAKLSASAAKPFKQLMRDVTFSLSGFQNPKRSDLREKAQEMGARFSPDWTDRCTHLICAFKNTPKYAQVNGKGYIVTENWILNSHREKEKLPWRLYRLSNAKSPPGSDNEQDELSKPSSSSTHASSDTRKTRQTESENNRKSTKNTSDPYLSSTDVDSDEDIQPPSKKAKASSDPDWSGEGSEESIDTDDEIAAHLAGNSPVKNADPKLDAAASSSGDKPLPVLPNFLEGKVFFLYGEVNDRRLVNRYINAYGGEVEDYMCDSVNYVITDSEWDENFDSALSDNQDLVFIKSKWIMDIHQQQRKIPHQKYAIVPK